MEGWVSHKGAQKKGSKRPWAGNKGTSYLKVRAKPLLQVNRPVELRSESALESTVLRLLEAGELLELLEGPREMSFEAKSFMDFQEGFVAIEDRVGSLKMSSLSF